MFGVEFSCKGGALIVGESTIEYFMHGLRQQLRRRLSRRGEGYNL